MGFERFLGKTTSKDTPTNKSAGADGPQQETSTSPGKTTLEKLREIHHLPGDSTPRSSKHSSVESLRGLRKQLEEAAKRMQPAEFGLEEVTTELKSLEMQEKQAAEIETLHKKACQAFLDHLTKRVCELTGLVPEQLYATENIEDSSVARIGISPELEEKLGELRIEVSSQSGGVGP